MKRKNCIEVENEGAAKQRIYITVSAHYPVLARAKTPSDHAYRMTLVLLIAMWLTEFGDSYTRFQSKYDMRTFHGIF